MKNAYEVRDGKCYVQLTQGKVAIIDVADMPVIAEYRWHFSKRYAMSGGSVVKGVRQKKVLMHRLLTNAPDDLEVDHIDGSGVNNTRDNLRTVTSAQNHHNITRQSNNTSGYTGVCYHKTLNLYLAYIKVSGKRVNLGWFKTAELAAKAYDDAKRTYHPTAPLRSYNFPTIS